MKIITASKVTYQLPGEIGGQVYNNKKALLVGIEQLINDYGANIKTNHRCIANWQKQINQYEEYNKSYFTKIEELELMLAEAKKIEE